MTEVRYKMYTILMVLCFLFGGFAVLSYGLEAYSGFLGRSFFGVSDFRVNGTPGPRLNETLELRLNATNATRAFGRGMPVETFLISPFAMLSLAGGVLLLCSGLALWHLTREKELATAKEKLTTLLLLPEERAVIEVLRKGAGSSTQAQLARETGFSKVKMHRLVARLAAKGVVKKHPYGATNKIVLEKDV